ncbi:MAG TPA: uracil-DNA glycosylase [Planctomycetota bacterium]|nr:uracil-DNA glycosylase [Planctomycetota bacterium]
MPDDPRAEALDLVAALRMRLMNAVEAGLDAIRVETPKPETAPHGKAGVAPGPPSPSPGPTARNLFDAPARPAKTLSTGEKVAALEEIAAEVRACTKCRLHEGRTNAVPGEGNPDARILFVGEGPGENEDLQGRPFVGRAGELLTKIVEGGMGLKREEVFIANVVKCRPPGNRVPLPDEAAACLPYLHRQIAAVSPELIVPLGKPATGAILESDEPMGKLRGKVFHREGRTVVPTFHPAYLLRNPPAKKEVWEDIQVAMREIGLPIPGPRRG